VSQVLVAARFMMYSEIVIYIKNLDQRGATISTERKKKLLKIVDFIRSKQKLGQVAKLTFICIHNSRRSHLCQIWSAVLVKYLGLDGIQTFSGGTEATTLNDRIVDTLKKAGFKIESPGGQNPHYRIFYDEEIEPLVCFSKRFDDSTNPKKDFAALMTCSEADQNCPFVSGAVLRLSIPYGDPKEADGTSREAEAYDDRCLQIATEMYYMLSQLT